jgi:ribosomal protein S18 acetylase RimI-like enzyme/predicted transcriptional regulator
VDLIKQLGPLALASRVRRLGEWLYKDVPRIYRERALDFEPRWFPLFYLLKYSNSVAVTAAASALGFSHAAINQIAGEMTRRGFVESIKDKKDERKRLLRLTKKGKAAISSLEPVWKDISAAANELVSETGGDFLEAISRLEDALNQRGMYERVIRRVKDRQMEKVEIVDYKPRFKRFFKTLNLEWLQEYHSVEEEDQKLLSDPYGKIIKTGGWVLFARIDKKIVGTVALIRHNKRMYQLTKMSVTGKARGRQAGRKLALEAIKHAQKAKARYLVLQTSPRMTAACNLYRSLGFVELVGTPKWATMYRRESIAMSLDLKKTKSQ